MYEIRKNQPAEEYFAADALNKSSVDLLLECPALYKARHDGAEEPSSKAFIECAVKPRPSGLGI